MSAVPTTEPGSMLSFFAPASSCAGFCVNSCVRAASKLASLFVGDFWEAKATSILENAHPTATILNNMLYLFWASPANDTATVQYMTYNGSDFSDVSGFTGVATQNSPSAVTFNGTIYLFYQGVDQDVVTNPTANGILYYTTYGSEQSLYINEGITGSPSAVVFNNQIYVFFQMGSGGSQIGYVTSSDGSSWSGITTLPDASNVASSPSVTIVGDWLYIVYVSSVTDGLGSLSYLTMDASGTVGEYFPAISTQGVPLYSAPSPTPFAYYDSETGVYVFYRDSSLGTAYILSTDGVNWSVPVGINSSQQNPGFPAVATVGGQIFCMMNYQNKLWYTNLVPDSSQLGYSGRGMATVPNVGHGTNEPLGMSQSPAAIYYNDTLFCFYLSGSSLYVVSGNTTDGWAENVLITTGVASGSSPGPVAFDGKLYVFFQGDSKNTLQYASSSDNGCTWSGVSSLGAGLWCGPSAVATDDTLYVFHSSSQDNGDLYVSTMDTSGQWTPDTNISNQLSQYYHYTSYAQPCAFIFNGQIYLAMVPTENNNIVFTPYPNSNDSYACANVPNGLTPTTSVSVTVMNGLVYVFWGPSDGQVYYMSTNDPLNAENWQLAEQDPVMMAYGTLPTVPPPGWSGTVTSLTGSCAASFAANGLV